MLEVARANAPEATFKEARAEALPFKDGWFERVVMWLSSHLVDREQRVRRGEPRARRRTDGSAIVTFDPSYFDAFWLNEAVPVDASGSTCERFSTAEELEDELRAAGFAEVELTRLSQPGVHERDAALERIRGKHISTFDLISQRGVRGRPRACRARAPRADRVSDRVARRGRVRSAGGLERACDRQRLTHQPP